MARLTPAASVRSPCAIGKCCWASRCDLRERILISLIFERVAVNVVSKHPSLGTPRSQSTLCERLSTKLCFVTEPNRSLADRRSQRGLWERGVNEFSKPSHSHARKSLLSYSYTLRSRLLK